MCDVKNKPRIFFPMCSSWINTNFENYEKQSLFKKIMLNKSEAVIVFAYTWLSSYRNYVTIDMSYYNNNM